MQEQTIKEKINDILQREHISARALAKRIGIHYVTLSVLINHPQKPSAMDKINNYIASYYSSNPQANASKA